MTGPTLRTLLELLARRAQDNPETLAFSFAGTGYSFAQLWERLNHFGASLLAQGTARGEKVILALPNGPDFFTAFYGIQRAGAVPVPLSPESGPSRLKDIAAHVEAARIVVPADAARSLRGRIAGAARVITVADSPTAPASCTFPDIAPDDLCFIQFTSGSTGDPKGVQLTHAKVLVNLQQLIAGMQITPADRFVSWLPLYHDMGLVMMSMVPFSLPAPLYLLPTRLTDSQAWLETIAVNRGTFTAAPDFAYRFCLRHLKDPSRFDLSSLRVALNAAEPVRAATLRQFEEVFGLSRVMMPGYGLAEACVGVSMWPAGTSVAVDSQGCVSVGPPFPGVEVRIGETQASIARGEVGEILVRSPATTLGYYGQLQATAKLFTHDGFIRTGDLGYVDEEGHLYVLGRLKDIIIQAGHNIAPKEVEETTESLSYVRYSAAVGIDRGRLEGEQVYIFSEIRPGMEREGKTLADMAGSIVCCFQDRFGFRPGRVYLLAANSIPRTANGKLQHGRLRARYLDGSLRREGLILYPDY